MSCLTIAEAVSKYVRYSPLSHTKPIKTLNWQRCIAELALTVPILAAKSRQW
jgi:hypothetical protein